MNESMTLLAENLILFLQRIQNRFKIFYSFLLNMLDKKHLNQQTFKKLKHCCGFMFPARAIIFSNTITQ